MAFVPALLLALALNLRGYRTVARIAAGLIVAASFVMPTVATGGTDGVEMWIVPMMVIPPLLVAPAERALLIFFYALFVATFVGIEAFTLLTPPETVIAVPNPTLSRITNLTGVTLVTAIIVFVYRRIITAAEMRAAQERERAERLLANILPDAIAHRLKRDEFPIADQAENVTVPFADVVNFTPYAAAHSADEVVNMLNRLFYAFDDMVERQGLEKIKTIGDAYMVAGGVPDHHADNAVAVADLAFEMLAFAEALRRDDGVDLNLRIGIHSGQVVAGVIGKRKLSYDLWGDTVNTAARLESASETGRIHVSEATAERLNGVFILVERGAVPLKGLGKMRTFFLSGRST